MLELREAALPVAESRGRIAVSDPATGEVVGWIDDQRADEVTSAVERVRAGRRAWQACDLARGRRIAERLETGCACVNDCILNAGDPELPLGGVKSSGIGARHGVIDGGRAFARPCALRIDRGTRARDAAWFPYRAATAPLVERALGWIWADVEARRSCRVATGRATARRCWSVAAGRRRTQKPERKVCVEDGVCR